MGESQELQEFRKSARDWLQANCPESQCQPVVLEERVWAASNIEFPSEDARLWFERMVAKGWTVPDWPEQYGGGGLSREQNRILQQEMRALGCRDPQYSFGTTMIGPVLLEYGTEEQKNTFLPKIARGELRWCQGYSEPGAGSDLAGLKTSAEDCGDHYIINGSKIWTSHADKADWIYCLVRTDFEAPKQRGISFLLFSMRQPGVTTRPITLLSGESDFCEVFFDNVRAEKCNLIGKVNEGWTVAKKLLLHERLMMSNLSGESQSTVVPIAIARQALQWRDGRVVDPYFRDRLAATLIERRALLRSTRRVVEEAKARRPSQTDLILKLVGTELDQQEKQLMMDMLGNESLYWSHEQPLSEDAHNLGVTRDWLFSFSNTIAGGSSEVQMNIIAKKVLNLPD